MKCQIDERMRYTVVMHALESFFRPRLSTVLPAFMITGVAAFLLYYGIDCALDSSGQCAQLPTWVQVVLVGILWPWGIMIRIFGTEQVALASVVGFTLSFIWVFLFCSAIRWGVEKMWKKRGK